MIGRHQLPVASPISGRALLRGAAGLFGWDQSDELASALSSTFGAKDVLLTDSGTSALILALRSIGEPGALVAMPAYGCVDLVAAAVHAGVRVALYDLDPCTLSPDLESVETAITSGAQAVVVAHLFGYPADIPGVQAIGDRFGARIIEDAAQGTGGLLQDRMLGAFGPLTVLSFGRGKGVTGGRGGALLTFDSESTLSVAQHRTLPSARRGWSDWSAAAAQWSVGRPNFYGLPAAIPALRLGETTYRDARAPRAMSRSAAAMIPVAFAEAPAAAVRRRATAEIYRVALGSAAIARSIDPIRSGQSGFLRFPVMMDSARSAAPRLGIYRSYPVPLVDEPAARSVLTAGHRFACGFPGARDLANRLFTLPTHHLMSDLDIRMVCSWLASQ